MKLNKGQKVVLVIYALVVLGLCVYVPWEAKILGFPKSATSYSVIWHPPQEGGYSTTLDASRLSTELFATTVLLGSLFFIFRKY